MARQGIISYDMCQFFLRLLVDVSAYHVVIFKYKEKAVLVCVPITWCTSAYNKDDLAGKSPVHAILVPVTG